MRRKTNTKYVKKIITCLEEQGIFNIVNGILVGKPQDEMYYEEYKDIYSEVIDKRRYQYYIMLILDMLLQDA